MIYKLAESKLLSGFIYGDTHTQEYIYLPGSELDSSIPLAVYEKKINALIYLCNKLFT